MLAKGSFTVTLQLLLLLLTLAAQRLRNVGWHSVAVHSFHQADRQRCGVSLGRSVFCDAIAGRLVTRRLSAILSDHQHCLLPLCVLCSWLDLHASGVAVTPQSAAQPDGRLWSGMRRQLQAVRWMLVQCDQTALQGCNRLLTRTLRGPLGLGW
jgi:hypothetical protein